MCISEFQECLLNRQAGEMLQSIRIKWVCDLQNALITHKAIDNIDLFQLHRDSRRDGALQSTNLRPSDDRAVSKGATSKHNGIQYLLVKDRIETLNELKFFFLFKKFM